MTEHEAAIQKWQKLMRDSFKKLIAHHLLARGRQPSAADMKEAQDWWDKEVPWAVDQVVKVITKRST